MTSQINGLLIKNFQLMKRQKASVICQVDKRFMQIITPILCLGFIALLKIVVETQLNNLGLNLKIDLPLLLNLNVYSKFNYINNLIRISNCDQVNKFQNQWYLFQFSNESSQNDYDYFGRNNGLPMSISDSGILESQKNVFQSKCESINRMSPYFIKAV